MTKRDLKKELLNSTYYDGGEESENEVIDYDCLIGIISELCDKVEKLEKWKQRVQSGAAKVQKSLNSSMESLNNLEKATVPKPHTNP